MPQPVGQSSPLQERTWWQRRVRDPFVAQLTQGITPEKIALTVAVGSACALCPILGTATFLCLIAGIILRLNQPMIQVVNLLCAPIHIPVIFPLVKFGQFLFGVQHAKPFSIIYMYSLLQNDPAAFMQRFGATVLHAFVGWAIAAPIWIAIIYPCTRQLFREIARIRVENAQRALRDNPPTHPVP